MSIAVPERNYSSSVSRTHDEWTPLSWWSVRGNMSFELGPSLGSLLGVGHAIIVR